MYLETMLGTGDDLELKVTQAGECDDDSITLKVIRASGRTLKVFADGIIVAMKEQHKTLIKPYPEPKRKEAICTGGYTFLSNEFQSLSCKHDERLMESQDDITFEHCFLEKIGLDKLTYQVRYRFVKILKMPA